MPDTLTDAERILLQIEGALPRLLFVLVGPSGVGKNTIIRKLLTNNPYMDRIRTYTTRAARKDEIQGDQYHFVSHEEFRRLALAGELMEADASIAGHDVYGLGSLYSMPKDLFAEIASDKHLVIAEVDIHGMRRLRALIPDCVTIFVFATPVDLQQHILERPDDHMDQASLVQRMSTAREQIRSAGEFDYLVFNEDDRLEDTVRLVEAIILAERARVRHGIDLQKIISPEAFGQQAERDSSA
jgi:guanylate kinase